MGTKDCERRRRERVRYDHQTEFVSDASNEHPTQNGAVFRTATNHERDDQRRRRTRDRRYLFESQPRYFGGIQKERRIARKIQRIGIRSQIPTDFDCDVGGAKRAASASAAGLKQLKKT